MTRGMLVVLVGMVGAPASAAAQDRVALNLVTHSEVTIDRPAAAIWPLIVDPSGWKKAANFLAKSSPNYYGDYFRFQIDRQVYPHMSDLLPAIHGRAARPFY